MRYIVSGFFSQARLFLLLTLLFAVFGVAFPVQQGVSVSMSGESEPPQGLK